MEEEKYNISYELILNEDGQLIKIIQKNCISFDKPLMKDFLYQMINYVKGEESIVEDFKESKEFLFDLNNVLKKDEN